MVTLGIDLAAQPADTGVCAVSWAERVTIELASASADDTLLTKLITKADRVGVDVPLGWPMPFVRAVADYQNQLSWAGGHGEEMQLRKTDQWLRNALQMRPLSVSADKIGVPAMRAAHLLSSLDPPLDRSGRGKVVEVYPAAALKCWGFPYRGYKRNAGRAIREQLLQSFVERTRRWIELTQDVHAACTESDHVFDALIAALVARAAHLGLVHPIAEDDIKTAQMEGWIALPLEDSLDRLA